MADVMQWHSRRVAACVLVLLYFNRQRRNRKRWNIIKVWTKPYISRNMTHVGYNTLDQELLLLVFLCRYTLKTKRSTDLKNSEFRRWIENLHVRLHVRPPFCEEPRKSREQRACFDWLTVTNTRSQTVHTSNTSLPARKSSWKSWPEFRHVLFVVNSLPTCLPTVFAPFTHTNLSLPTRVCQL